MPGIHYVCLVAAALSALSEFATSESLKHQVGSVENSFKDDTSPDGMVYRQPRSKTPKCSKFIYYKHDRSFPTTPGLRIWIRRNDGSYFVVELDQLYADRLHDIDIKYGMPLKIIIHGFAPNRFGGRNRGGCEVLDEQLLFKMADDYFEQNSELNIMIFDWTEYASRVEGNYHIAADNTADAAGFLLQFLLQFKGTGYLQNYDNVHLIGFSLGAHVAGQVGRLCSRLAKHHIGRITGLDPAGPSFVSGTGYGNCKARPLALKPSDAQYVDVMHCNMEPLCLNSQAWPVAGGNYGTRVPSGNVDFYINGGIEQPGCERDECSHLRCVEYFSKSINNVTKACCFASDNEGCETCPDDIHYGLVTFVGEHSMEGKPFYRSYYVDIRK